ncbi:hypothetical protein BGW41_005565 [Actinomortierella wolfii]|nr:hypothetical protein BGW41_005565 [Actinomortierella wolfii]
MFSCTIEECLDDFVHLDTIHDFNCRKCTVLNALKEVDQIIDNAQRRLVSMDSVNGVEKGESHHSDDMKVKENSLEATSSNDSSANSRRRRSSGANKMDESRIRANLAQALQWKSKIQECLQYNIEMDLSPIELTPVRSKRTTKHSMIAKPPQALCLHLNRSMYTPAGTVVKNHCNVQFKRMLDFTAFTTSGHLTTEPTRSMSQRTKPAPRTPAFRTASIHDTNGFLSGLPTGTGQFASNLTSSPAVPVATTNKEDRVRYRLEAVLVHLGSHNSGHFVTYRRVPEGRLVYEQQQQSHLSKDEGTDPSSLLTPSFSTVKLQDSALKNDVAVIDDEDDDEMHLKERWWRISDEVVELVTWETVRQAEAYMLFYEKMSN